MLKYKPLVKRVVAAALFVYGAAVLVLGATTFLTVSPANLQGWQIQRSTSGTVPTPTPTPDVLFVTGPATPPLGTGSAEFRLGPDGGGAAQLRHPGYAGTRLPNPSATATPAANELTSLSYSTFTQQDGSGGQSPYIILQIDTDGDAGIEDLLFFEPVYQSATFCPANPQPALVTGQWQTWDAFNGCWYSVFGTAGSGPGTNTVSLRTLSAALPTGVIANSSPSGLGGVRLVTGFGAGAWDNYIGNADAFRIGVGANDTLYNFDPTQTTPVAGALVISEFRTRGPGGSADEYVEIYNNTNSAHVVSPPDGSGGYAAAASDGAARCVIPFGTTIPARGHFLCAGTGYTLGAYAALDAAIATDIGDSQGLALYSTSNPANFTAGTRLDAAGFSGSAAGYSEGTPLSPAGGITDNSEHAFVRKQGTLTGGLPQDTNNNEGDFAFVATDGAAHSGRAAVLGAPGPQNTLSPISRNLTGTLIAPTLASTAAPNRERNLTAGPCATNGTLTLRRTITNNTGANVTRLRFRVVDVTTVNSPGSANTAQAIVRVLDSPDEPALSVPGRGTVQVHGLTIETPPAQPGCGGLNTSLTDDEVTVGTPIPSGGSVDVIFRLGIERGGSYRFYVNIEVLP